jgi:HAD superfamily hydrolase (TIGR01490 family)
MSSWVESASCPAAPNTWFAIRRILDFVEAAFFDLDKTIIAKSSVLAFGRPFYREGLLSRRAVMRSMVAQVIFLLVGADENKMEKVRESLLAVTKGWDQEHIRNIVRDTLDDVVVPIIFAEARDLIDEHRAAGRLVVIISSAPMEVVEPLARYLGAHEAIGTRARIDDNGKYSGELEFYAYGEHKADAVNDFAKRNEIDLENSYAYSDSITDVPMLSLVGNPVAVNPDRELAKVAREREWPIRSFERPVSLRDRVPVPSKGPVMIAAGAALVGAGVAVGYWAYKRNHGKPFVPPVSPKTVNDAVSRAEVVVRSSADAVRAVNRIAHALGD